MNVVRSALASVAMACITLTPAMPAQATLASRVASAPDGVVRVQFDSRPGSCGDGRTMIGYRTMLFARDYSNVGRWRDQRCVPGPVRVALALAGGVVTHVSTQLGGNWPGADGRVTDLGIVPAPEASAYFFALVPRLDAASTRDRLLLPAVLADGGAVISPLLALARDGARSDGTRRQALQWLGLLGDSSAVPVLVGFAMRAPADDERGSGEERLREHAVFSLSQRDDPDSFDALMRIARGDADSRLRGKALFWLAQKHDPRVTALISELVLK